MKYLQLILLLGLLSGCTNHKYTVQRLSYIDSAFKQYIDCFDINTGYSAIPDQFNITFDTRVSSVSQCFKSSDREIRHISINPNEWAMMSTYQREWALFHELGHCALDLSHDDDTFNFMNTFQSDNETIENNRIDLFTDFFGESAIVCEYE